MKDFIEAFANHWGVEQLLTELGEALHATSSKHPFDRLKFQAHSKALSDAASGCLQARNELAKESRDKL